MDKQTIERVRTGLNDPRTGPETIALMLTGTCNLSCVYCRGGRIDDGRSNGKGSELSAEELFGLFEDARNLKVREINIGGMRGEPFCRQDIRRIMRKIKELGLTGSMTTNGSMLNGGLAAEMSGYGWDILLLSLDAPFAGLQHSLRPAVNKKEYFPNITEFLDTLEKTSSKIRVLVNMVITRHNYGYFPEMVKFVNKYKNIESLNILKLIDMGLPGYSDLQLDREQSAEFRQMLAACGQEKKVMYAGNWAVEENITGLSVGAEGAGCFTNYYILSIDANGDVLHCPQQYRVIPGLNIRNMPLRELWLNELLSFRRGLARSALCYDECCTILKEQNKLIRGSVVPGE